MKKMIRTLALLTGLVLLISGCAAANPYPEMTDAQYEMVVRYASGLITRYAKGTSDKLTYLDREYTPEHLQGESTTPYERQDGAGQEASVPATDTANAATSASAPAPQKEETPDKKEETAPGEDGTQESDHGETDALEPEGGDGVDLPPEEGNPQEQETADNTQTETETVSYTGIEQSGLQTLADNIRVEYTGYSVKNVYPDTQAQGAVSAAPGDKLLVVDFSIQNVTDETLSFNTASRNPQFKLVINGNIQGFTMVTMIANDLSGMDVELAPSGRADAVLLMEVPEDLAKNVDTLDLIIKIRGEEEHTVKLE